MLAKLSIKNYAIIAQLDIEFHKNLTVITGETGAGKSIILGALSLLLGERADTSVLIQKSEKCVIEGFFEIKQIKAAAAYLEQEGFDYADTTIIRREIATNGKSRAFINDTPATLAQLQQLGIYLVDLNRQFDNQLLHQMSYQYNLIDVLADNQSLYQSYKNTYQLYNNQLDKYNQLKEKSTAGQAAFEYHTYLYDELKNLDIQVEEFETLENKVAQATHQEFIAKIKSESLYKLSESDDNQIYMIKSVANSLQQIVAYQASVSPLIDRLHSIVEELKDISYELSDNHNFGDFSSSELSDMQTRLDLGFKLMKKHQVDSTQGLLDKMQDLEVELFAYSNVDKDLQDIENEINILANQLKDLSSALYENRIKAAAGFEKDVMELLARIGMPNAVLKVDIKLVDRFNVYGSDELNMLIDANKSGRFLPLSKVASGGEMSRILLSIKSLISNKLSLGTLIFDEVDSAISGEAAKQVALLIQALSQDQQTIVLTHQAQMAAKGNLHLYIYKAAGDEGQLHTNVQILDDEDRVLKIAQMIDGNNPGAAALESVQAMMQ